MSTRRFLILDVFAEQKLTGNQLAVVQDSHGLDAETMQRIKKMHQIKYNSTSPNSNSKKNLCQVNIVYILIN